MKQVDRLIYKQMLDPSFSTDLLSRQLSMSRSQLFRRLKQVTGLSPSEYLRSIRLQQAKELMASGKCESVKAAAQAVGMVHMSKFSAHFKAYYGVLPSDFMANPEN